MVMSSLFPRVGETRLCRVRAPLMRPLNLAAVVIVAAALVHHIETKVMEVELVPVTNRLQSMVPRTTYKQSSKATQLH